MQTRLLSTLLLTFSVVAFGAHAAAPDKGGAPDHFKMMAGEPHHVIAMAYHQNLAVFAKALHEQTKGKTSINVDFARTAVVEMRRSFDLMTQHHEDHLKTMSPEQRAQMSERMESMKTHRIELNTALAALGQEVQAPTPDAKKVFALADRVCAHLELMEQQHQGGHMKVKK